MARRSSHGVDAEIDDLLSLASDAEEARPGPSRSNGHAGEKRKCQWDQCDETCPTQASLVQHIHSGNFHFLCSLTEHIGAGKESYACMWEDCPRFGQTQATRHSLITHCRAHTGERPYSCPHPGEFFSPEAHRRLWQIFHQIRCDEQAHAVSARRHNRWFAHEKAR
jgi:hypothetical protein